MKNALLMVLLVHILAVAGLVGFLAASGRLDREKSLTILDLLQHPGSPDKLRERTYEILEKFPATQPATATAPATAPTPAPSGSAAERLEVAQKTLEAERLKLDNEARELRHRQELLERLQADVAANLARVEREKKLFQQQVLAASTKVRDEAFARSLTLYAELKPKQVKDLFLALPKEQAPKLVADFLLAMESERAGKIIAEFRTPEEKAFITTVLERIRTATPAGAPAASTANSAAAVSNRS